MFLGVNARFATSNSGMLRWWVGPAVLALMLASCMARSTVAPAPAKAERSPPPRLTVAAQRPLDLELAPVLLEEPAEALEGGPVVTISDDGECRLFSDPEPRLRGEILIFLRGRPSQPQYAMRAEFAPIMEKVFDERRALLRCFSEPYALAVLENASGTLRVSADAEGPAHARCIEERLSRVLHPQDVPGKVEVLLTQQPLLPTKIGLDEIMFVVDSHLGDIKQCAIQHDAMDYVTSGHPIHYPVRFSISAYGELRSPVALNRDARLVEFGCCLLSKMTHWRFPKPGGRKDSSLTITYPFGVKLNKVAQE